MRRKRRERPRPMPTEEEKKRAQIKAAGADPLVWAMKSVDEKFPDEREKDIETIKAEAAVEETTEATEPENKSDTNTEIEAEGKTTMPTNDGVMTVEVTPMRQDVSNVSPDEVKTKTLSQEISEEKNEDDNDVKVKKVHGIKKSPEKSDNHKVQIKLTNLESKQKKMMIGIAALVLLAIGGVVFGVVAMVKQNETTKELENQIAAAGVKNDEIDGEYINLKDWGLKIKIVTGLNNISYNYQTDDYAEVLIWGSKQDASANYTPDFAKQAKNSNPLGTVVRIPRYERGAAGRLIWYDDYYNYYYQGPTGVPAVSESEMSWWVESYLLIKDMLTNADNYIKSEDSTVGQQ